MNVREYLNSKGVYFTEHHHNPAYTAQELAAEEHVSGKRTAKTVVVRADDSYALCVVPASHKLDLEKVARALGASSVRLADEREMASLFPDDDIGAEPPFGNLYNMRTLLDPHLTRHEEILFEAGSHEDAIAMRSGDYVSTVQPELAELTISA